MHTHPEPSLPDAPALLRSRWALASRGDGKAFKELAESYWYCVYAWWRRAGLDAVKAPTATLASFSRWLSGPASQESETDGNRLREWIPARLAELSVSGVKLQSEPPFAIDAVWAEARYADEPNGDAHGIFQRRWALTILEFATNALKGEYVARGEDKLFEELLAFAGFEPSDDERYATAASRTGRTSGAMRKAVFDFRTRHRELLRGFVADTVKYPQDIESEITALLLACDGVGPQAATAPLPTVLQSVQPDQVLARAMNSVKMSTAGSGGWTPPTVQEAARLFQNYEVVALLGRGGMGAVYQARQTALDRLVAIKLLPLEVSVDKDFADRFRREAKAMAKLNHPNIISVFDFGQTSEGHLYFVMEFVDGAMLHTLIHGPAPIQPAEALILLEQVCDALAYAHGKGIVHRDIKPANVMVEREGRVKVADFGLARLTDGASAEQWGTTMTGIVMGTPDYMSPEQKRGSHVDHRADIYALGVMLYEMICKETPQGAFILPSKHCGIDKRLDGIVTKALATKPDERFQSTAEMRTAIEVVRPAVAKAQAKKTPPVPHAPVKPKPSPVPSSSPVTMSGKSSYAKIAVVGILFLSAVAFVFVKWRKPAVNMGATANVIATTTTTSDLTPSPSIEQWKNALLDQSFAQWPGLQINAANAVFTKGQGVDFQDGPTHDVAVRIRALLTDELYRTKLHGRGSGHGSYSFCLNPDRRTGKIELRVENSYPPLDSLRVTPLRDTLRLNEIVEYELRITGTSIVGRINGQVVVEGNDNRYAEGRYGFSKIGDGRLEVKALEYLDLSPTLKVAGEAKSTPVSEPGAIKLWDSPEKLPKSDKVSWRDDAIYIDDRGVLHSSQVNRDSVVRASVRMNPDTKVAALAVRDHRIGADSFLYELKLTPSEGSVALEVHSPIKSGFLGRWRLPRAYAENEWIRLELRSVGNLFSVTADGQSLGTVTDDSVNEAGGMGISAAASGYFRDVVYVPLDKPQNTPGPSLEQWKNALLDPVFARAQALQINAEGAVFTNATKEQGFQFVNGPNRNGAIRVRALLTDELFQVKIYGRESAAGLYKFGLNPDRRTGKLERMEGAYFPVDSERVTPLGDRLRMNEPVELELRIVGASLVGKINGQVVVEGSDARLTDGKFGFVRGKDGKLEIKTLEYLDLSPSAAEGGQSPSALAAAGSPKSASSKPAPAASNPTASATKDASFVNTLGMKFVPVPIVGGPTGGQRVLFSIWETRVQDYEVFAKDTNREIQKVDFQQGPTHPAVNLSWEDAKAFCTWLTERERKSGKIAANERYRLPSDHEWSCAVGIGDREDAAKAPAENDAIGGRVLADVFPWGNSWPPTPGAGNYSGEETIGHERSAGQAQIYKYRDAFPDTAPVGSFAGNEFGLFDLGGNAAEFCEDWFDTKAQLKVNRGSNFNSNNRNYIRSSARNSDFPSAHHVGNGFRVVLSVESTLPPSSLKPNAATPAPAANVPASSATKEAPFVNTLGMKFVPVPIIGGPSAGQRVLFSVWDTRVQDYATFVKEKKPEWPKADFSQGPTEPAVNVSWDNAQAFCQWMTERDHSAGRLPPDMCYRLPSDHEWSCAVGIADREDVAKRASEKNRDLNDVYPWGNQWPPPPGAGNYAGEEVQSKLQAAKINGFIAGYKDDFVHTSPVGSFPANRFGLFDLGGNVWQWCEDYADDGQSKYRVKRGAAWDTYDRGTTLSSFRHFLAPASGSSNLGFRCVLSQVPPSKVGPGNANSAATFESAIKDSPFLNSLGMKFVPVPIKGGPTDGQRVLFSIWETRVGDYQPFAVEMKAKWPKPSFEQGATHPAVNVNWADAQLFCKWLTDREQKAGRIAPNERYRLPTDHEWSCAAGVEGDEDANALPSVNGTKARPEEFPWGKQWPPPLHFGNYSGEEATGNPNRISSYRDDFAGTAPVGSFQANSFGLFDLSGNASELCEDEADWAKGERVVRGASYMNADRRDISYHKRFHVPPRNPAPECGFRLVLAKDNQKKAQASSPKPVSVSCAVATKEAPFENSLGMKFVPVPITGGPTSGQRVLFSIWDTRVQDYEVFAQDTKREYPKVDFPQGPAHPAVKVSWDDAKAFCKWLTERDQKNGVLPGKWSYRLPSDHEWSCAAGIGDREDPAKLPEEKNGKLGDVYPWGTQWPPPAGVGNYAGEELRPAQAAGKFRRDKDLITGYNDGFVNTSPVGSFTANRFGLFDIGGNVWQWCEDWSDKDKKDRVLRGGGAWDDAGRANSSRRIHFIPGFRGIGYGFRCVVSETAH